MSLKSTRFLRSLVILLLFLSFTACGSRLPTAKRSHHMVTRYFEKYGKKYKDSDFGKGHVNKVEIGNIREMQKKMASVEAYVYLDSGPVYWIRATCLKKTFGWRVLNWETLGSQSSLPSQADALPSPSK